MTDGYRHTGIKCDGDTISVAGLDSDVSSFEALTIPGDILKLDDASTDVVKTVDLSKLLPKGIILAGNGRKEVNVTMMVERLEDEVFIVELDYGCYVGDSDKYIYRAEPNRVSVRIRGLREELDRLSVDADDLAIDVTGLEEGSHLLNVEFATELDPVYEVVAVGTCTVNVTKIPDGPGATQAAVTEETVKAE